MIKRLAKSWKFLDPLRGVVGRTRRRHALFDLSDTPHLDEAAIALLTSSISPGTVLLEYGAGASTLFAARQGATVVSSESSRAWCNKVNRSLRAAGSQKSVVVYANIGRTGEWGYPLDPTPSAANLRRWKRYVEAPWSELQTRGLEPDIILIDGRFRLACALYCAMKVHSEATQFLIDDFVDRPSYQTALRYLTFKKMVGRMAVFTRDPKIDSAELEKQFLLSIAECA